MAILANESVDVRDNAATQGKLVSVTGSILTDLPLGDDQFLIPGNYAVVDRTVEMYSWYEREQTQKKKKLGGSEIETTTYTYTKKWTKDSIDSSKFKYAAAHSNPTKSIPDRLFKATSVRIDRYNLDMNSLSYVTNFRSNCSNRNLGNLWSESKTTSMYRSIVLRSSDALTLTAQNTQQQSNSIITPKYIFRGLGSPQAPQVGDVRVCYAVMPVGAMVTVFGRLDQSQITVYPYQNVQFLRLIPGNRLAALKILGNEEIIWKWVFRFLGFFLMWLGIAALLYPIVVLFDFFPWLGWFVEILGQKLAPLLALAATIATILLSL